MDDSSTFGKPPSESSSKDIESIWTSIQNLEKNRAAMGLDIQELKETMRCLQVEGMPGQFKKELEKVDVLQKVFNRMIVNGNKTDLVAKIEDLTTAFDALCTKMRRFEHMDLENKILEFQKDLENLHEEIQKFQQKGGLEEKVKNVFLSVDELQSENMDFGKKIDDLAENYEILENEIQKLSQHDLEEKINELFLTMNSFRKFEDMDLEKKAPYQHLPMKGLMNYDTDMCIKVTSENSMYILNAKPNLTIGEVKSVLENMAEIPIAKQVLQFGDTTLADDDQTLKDYGIEDRSVISLMKTDNMVKIFVEVDKKQQPLDIKLSNTVLEIKSKIEEMTKVDPTKQMLTFKQNDLADEARTLGEYGIVESSVLHLKYNKKSSWQLQVRIQSNHDVTVRLPVDIKTSVEDLIPRIHHKMKIPMDEHQALYLNRTKLDHSKLLVECGVKYNSVLDLKTKEIKRSCQKDKRMETTILVNTGPDLCHAQVIPLKVCDNTTMGSIKNLLHLKTEMLPSGQTISRDGKHLNDYESVFHCGIPEHTIIDVAYAEKREREQITVKVYKSWEQANPIKESMDLQNTGEHLKWLIEDKWGLDTGAQILILCGAETECPENTNGREFVKINSGITSDQICFKDIILSQIMKQMKRSILELVFLLILHDPDDKVDNLPVTELPEESIL